MRTESPNQINVKRIEGKYTVEVEISVGGREWDADGAVIRGFRESGKLHVVTADLEGGVSACVALALATEITWVAGQIKREGGCK